MIDDISTRRRAIYTGLKPFMAENELLDAILHWESHYAAAPRFTLQRFVSELCREGDLRGRRADVLLSLVQAMSLPASSLLPDPVSGDAKRSRVSISQTAAFEVLMNALMESAGRNDRYSLRLDLIASLDTRKLPVQFCHALQRWLGDKAPLNVSGVETRLLRIIVNRTYVILCERVGPVQADRILANAVNSVAEARPELSPAVEQLL